MRLLFEMDKNDYAQCTHNFVRNSSRSIMRMDGKVAMLHCTLHDYYKFPGGGIEKGESPAAALIRETREEAGLIVIPESIKEYGYVHRIQKSDWDDTVCFIQDNYYYHCEAERRVVPQTLEDYEAEEGFQLEYVVPSLAIRRNRSFSGSAYNPARLERAARVLELLIADGLL